MKGCTQTTTHIMDDVKNAFLKYLEDKKTKAGTRKAYRRVLEKLEMFVEVSYEPRPALSNLKKPQLEAFLRDTCKADSPTSWNNHLAVLRSLFKYLFEEGIVDVNEAARIRRVKVESEPKDPLSFEDIWRVLRAYERLDTPFQERNQALLIVAFQSGLRVSELASLTCDQVSQERSVITDVKVKGQGERRRLIDLTPTAKMYIAAWLSARTQFIDEDKPTEALFLSNKGAPLSVRQIHAVFADGGREAGLEQKVHPHLLRHSFITEVSRSGARERVTQVMAGHKDIKSTQRYNHVARDECREASKALDSRWQAFVEKKTTAENSNFGRRRARNADSLACG